MKSMLVHIHYVYSVVYTYIHIHYFPRLYHVTHTFFPVEMGILDFEFISLKVFLLMSLLFTVPRARLANIG